MDYKKLNKDTKNEYFSLPFIYHRLDRPTRKEYYCFSDGYSGYNQITIGLEDEEKTTFTCPYRTFAFRRISFGLYSSLTMFQRCMMSIFSYMVEQALEASINDFSIFRGVI